MPTVLVVDDEADLRTVTELALRVVGGFRVLLASDGATGVELARSAQPDLILLDVMMPGESGVSVLARLLADPLTSGIPVAFMTARAHGEEMVRLRALGARDVIAKPFDPMELADRVRPLCRSHA